MPATLVALGGNALHRADGDGSWTEARRRMRATAQQLALAVRAGHDLAITHGNGPQVGALLRQNELGAAEIPARPMDALGAETQGQIGYLVTTELSAALARERVDRTVLALVGRTEVSARDPAFRRPTKPVGRYYTEDEARLLRKQRAWTMASDPARGGWRRLVPSPRPTRWLEAPLVRRLWSGANRSRWIPVVAGGGGIPVVRRASAYEGVEAVIDKDLSAALVAAALAIPVLVIVTDVPGAALAFGRPGERWLRRVGRAELAELYRRGEFAEGSMGPKVEAGLEFLARGGRRFIITEIPSLGRALHGGAGTQVE